jgi:integrase
LSVLKNIYAVNKIDHEEIKIPSPVRRTRFMVKEEIDKLLFLAEPYPLAKLVMQIELYTGLRWNNIATLTWGQIDFKTGNISVIAKGNQPLIVPLGNEIAQILYDFKPPNAAPTKKVIDSPQKRYEEIKLCIKRAKLKDVVFHTFRHSFISNLIMNGVDLPTVAMIVGHKNINTTMRYVHITNEHHREAINRAWKDKPDSSNLRLIETHDTHDTHHKTPTGKSTKPTGQMSLFG